MLQAILVEKLDANPLIVLGSLSIDDDADAQSEMQRAVEAYNATAVASQAEGALIWSDKVGAQKFEFRLGYEGLIEQRFGETKNLSGPYTCESGRSYKYYGKCVSWVPGKRSFWEIHLFHHDKIFTDDGVSKSRDLLNKFDGDLLNLEVGIETLRAVARDQAHQRIEEWDRTIPFIG